MHNLCSIQFAFVDWTWYTPKKNILYKLYIVTFIVSNFIVHIFCHTGIIDISATEIFLPPWIWHLSRVVTAFDTKSPINQLFWFYEVARLFLLKLSWISFFIAFVCSTSTLIDESQDVRITMIIFTFTEASDSHVFCHKVERPYSDSSF